MTIRIREDDFQAQLIDVARLLGWRVAHFRPALTKRGWRTPVSADGEGFPDLLLVRGERCMAVECKSKRGALSEKQAAWLTAMQQAGIETHVWKPDDFDFAVERLT